MGPDMLPAGSRAESGQRPQECSFHALLCSLWLTLTFLHLLQVSGQAAAKRPYASAIKKRLISVVETGSCGRSGGSSSSDLSGDGQEAGTSENWPGAAASSASRWVSCWWLSGAEQEEVHADHVAAHTWQVRSMWSAD